MPAPIKVGDRVVALVGDPVGLLGTVASSHNGTFGVEFDQEFRGQHACTVHDGGGLQAPRRDHVSSGRGQWMYEGELLTEADWRAVGGPTDPATLGALRGGGNIAHKPEAESEAPAEAEVPAEDQPQGEALS